MNNKTSLRLLAVTCALAVPFALASCSGGAENTGTPSSAVDAGACPTAPVGVVVSVDQWGDIVSQLGGACADVSTLLASSSVDPHDYEPAPADAAKFQGAQLVVINGGHYDEWAAKLADTSVPDAPVLSAIEFGAQASAEHEHEHEGEGTDAHEHDGVNPHVWYDPAAVVGLADAVTKQLSDLAPDAADYFAQRRSEFDSDLKAPKGYDDVLAALRTGATGKTYAATESVFDPMAAAIGLQNRTPAGYQAAASNEADPSPADLDAFLRLLNDKGVDVLIFNTQTEGAVPNQLRSAAEAAGIAVVNVTETVAPGSETFQAWQVDQLTSLAKALGVSA